jgi:hypothetical protein
VARRFVFACEFGISEATASDLRHSKLESLRIVSGAFFGSTIIETKNLFVYIAEQMKRLDSDIGSTKAALQQRPEVLKAVRVDAAIDVPFRMIHNAMDEVVAHLVVTDCVIRIDFRAILDVFEQDVLQGLSRDVRHNFGADLAQIAIQDALHNRLTTVHSALLYEAQLAILVHILGEAADKRFIGFEFGIRSTQFRRRAECPIVQRGAEPLKHEPCRLLRNAKRAVNLHTGNAVLAIDQHPKTSHPLVKSDRGILKDRIDLERELPIAATAEPQLARFDEVVRFRTATRAMHLPIRPAKAHGVIESPLRIGEVNDGLLESSWRLHEKKHTPYVRVCQVYIYLWKLMIPMDLGGGGLSNSELLKIVLLSTRTVLAFTRP